MPGPAGQELKDRRRRSAAFLLGSDKEAAEAPWNISDVGTKAIDVPTTERLTPLLCGFGELPIPAETKILFGPAERPERRESKNKAIPLKILNA